MIESLGFLGRAFGKVLEFFGQKIYVFIEVSSNSGTDRPYCLIVKNNSKYEVVVEKLIVSPDGFPDSNNGWQLNESKLFQNQTLKPTQKIKLYLQGKDITGLQEREFKVVYKTRVLGKLIPREEESCKHTFDLKKHVLRVSSSITISTVIND
jgi:hypothetical protein